ncbi:uncharacterized protein [Euwallacea fornicatus]|uniref:uncharacterized protein n=1 Tax=Euwallacea fornicatus TaxID=995702 RepID=UPI00338ECE61
MSLSQKFSGLILVPWFNSAEWEFVYHSVYSENVDKQHKALELLKLWKTRTPILSTGVEGTLIILEALLHDTDLLSSEQLANHYAIALMRFLNLSAANSEKQGCFAKTSAKNELPKWLINLRHDVAHGHQIPCLFNLKMGLDFGFNWLREKYWKPQSKIIKDLDIGGSNQDQQLIKSFNAFVDVTMSLFKNCDLNVSYRNQINMLIRSTVGKTTSHLNTMSNILFEIIHRILRDLPKLDESCWSKLLSNEAMLKPHFSVTVTEHESVKLETKFRDIWKNLLNVLHQYGLLFLLVEKLFDVTGDISHKESNKKMAALWINEILQALIQSSDDTVLELEPSNFTYEQQAQDFQKIVLYHADLSQNYINYFIDSLLQYANSDSKAVIKQDIDSLFEAKIENSHCAIAEIQVGEELLLAYEDHHEILVESGCKVFTEVKPMPEPIRALNKWQKLKDTSAFKSCPLGVLPHQVGQSHPFLIVD